MPKTEKCLKCGWFDGARYHVCVVPITDTPVSREVEYEERVLTPSRAMRVTQREAISESQKERWRSVNLERDIKIVERYAQGDISYAGLADEFGVSRSTIFSVMKAAKAADVVDPRQPGTSIKNGG